MTCRSDATCYFRALPKDKDLVQGLKAVKPDVVRCIKDMIPAMWASIAYHWRVNHIVAQGEKARRRQVYQRYDSGYVDIDRLPLACQPYFHPKRKKTPGQPTIIVFCKPGSCYNFEAAESLLMGLLVRMGSHEIYVKFLPGKVMDCRPAPTFYLESGERCDSSILAPRDRTPWTKRTEQQKPNMKREILALRKDSPLGQISSPKCDEPSYSVVGASPKTAK